MVVADDAAQDGAGDRADQGRHRPEHRGEGGFLLGEDPQEQHLRKRHDRTADQAQQHAAAKQHSQRTGKPAKQGDQGKADIAGEEHPLGAEASRQPAGQGHRDRFGHGIGGDHPGALAGRYAERPGDGGDRDIGDGGVEHHQEIAQPDQQSRPRSRGYRSAAARVPQPDLQSRLRS